MTVGLARTTHHYTKQVYARRLSAEHALPDIADLLSDLNDARKAYSYGDVDAPELNPEDVAIEIESYFDAVQDFARHA